MSTTTSRGAPYPQGSDPNDAPGYIHQLATWVSDRPGIATLTTTQRNALSGVELWTGRHIFNTTTGRLEYYTGSLWLPTPLPGRVLGVARYTTTATITMLSTTDADVDATHLAVTFVAPASGAVSVELEGTGAVNAGTSPTSSTSMYWSVREATTTHDTSFALVGSAAISPAPEIRRGRVNLSKSGLTPGTSYTFKWGYKIAYGVAAAPTTSELRVGALDPAIMRVVEA